jgi:hypothetical protein
MALDAFQARVAQLALGAAAAHGFALAGGNVLAAHGLLSRPTEDEHGCALASRYDKLAIEHRGGGVLVAIVDWLEQS